MKCHQCEVMFVGDEFEHGLCMRCWLNLTPAERAIARGEEPTVEKAVETEHRIVRRIYSEGPWLIVACLWLWRIGMSVLVVLLWRRGM